jgi:ABC-2 type transport system permease protein
MRMKRSLFQLTLIHFREFIREPGILFWSIAFPILIAWVLGVAFTRKPETIHTIPLVCTTGAINPDIRSFLIASPPDSLNKGQRSFSRVFENDEFGKTTFRFIITSWDSAILMIKRGKTQLILKDDGLRTEFHFDSRSSDAKLIYITLSALIRNGQSLIYPTEIKPLTRVGTRYVDFLVPGLLAMGMMNSLFWGICYNLIEMRMKKLLRRMVATPMKKWEFLLSHFLARMSLSIVESIILLGFSYAYFGITIQGSLLAFALIFVSGVFCFGGISVLIASRVGNTRVGASLVNAFTMPMTVLSGVFFSYHNFPDVIIPFIRALPLTMLADSIRGIFIEGAGIQEMIVPAIVLNMIGVVTFFLGLRFYRWY